MSVRISALCWKVPLPATEKLVLLRLADFADDQGYNIYPAVQTVADDCGCGHRIVQLTLKKLIGRGLLVVMNQGGGRCRTTEYAIDLEVLKAVGTAPPTEPGYKNGHAEKGANSEPSAPFMAQNSEPSAPFAGGEKGEKGARSSQNPAPRAPNPLLPVIKEEGGGSAGAGAREVATRVAGLTGLPAAGRNLSTVEAWLTAGYDPERDIYPAVAAVVTAAKEPIGSFKYFTAPIGRYHADRMAPPPNNVSYLPNAAGGRRGNPGMSDGARDLLAAYHDPNFDYGVGR